MAASGLLILPYYIAHKKQYAIIWRVSEYSVVIVTVVGWYPDELLYL